MGRYKKVRINDLTYTKIKELALQNSLSMCHIVEQAITKLSNYDIQLPHWQPSKIDQLTPEYLAGIWDGEGSFGIIKTVHRAIPNGFRLMPYCSVSNTQKDLLELIDKNFRIGFIYKNKANSLSKKWKSVWVFKINGQRGCLEVIDYIGDYLILKKEHARLLYRFCRKERRGLVALIGRVYDEEDLDIYHRLKELNKRGI